MYWNEKDSSSEWNNINLMIDLADERKKELLVLMQEGKDLAYELKKLILAKSSIKCTLVLAEAEANKYKVNITAEREKELVYRRNDIKVKEAELAVFLNKKKKIEEKILEEKNHKNECDSSLLSDLQDMKKHAENTQKEKEILNQFLNEFEGKVDERTNLEQLDKVIELLKKELEEISEQCLLMQKAYEEKIEKVKEAKRLYEVLIQKN